MDPSSHAHLSQSFGNSEMEMTVSIYVNQGSELSWLRRSEPNVFAHATLAL